MLQSLLAAVVTLACVSDPRARAQPILCQDDEQCSSGYYCGAHTCLDCLRCEDLHRDPPLFPTSCIKSVLECGSCYDGLVNGEVNSGCVPAESRGGGGGGTGTSPYVWLGVGVALLAGLVAIGVALFMYLNRNNPATLRIDQTAQISCTSVPQNAAASAPPSNGLPPPNGFPPPPYNPEDYHDSLNHGEDDFLLAKPSVEPLRPGARELAGRQEARPINHPRVRNIPQPESSGMGVATDPESRPTTPEQEARAADGLDAPFAVLDDNTMESGWRPDTDNNNIAMPVGGSESQAASDLCQALAVRRSAHVTAGPPAKIPCLQDTNNNRSSGSGASSSDESTSGSAPGGRNPSVTLNFNLNVSTSALQQVNNLSL